MKIARILGFVLAGVLLLLVVGVVVALIFIDIGSFKPQIAEAVKKATGRELTIAGDLRLNVSLVPGIVAEDVTLSNAEWGSRPDMVSVEHLEVRVALASLISGVVEIEHIELVGADILLEVDPQGRANFDFAPPDAAPEEAEKPAAADAGIGALPLIDEAEIRNSRLTYANAATGAAYTTVVEALTLRSEGRAAPLVLVYEGSINEAPIRANASLGSPAGLFDAGTPWPVDITVESGGATVTVAGTIAEPLAGMGLDLTVSLKGDRTRDLSKIVGAEMPELGPYALSVQVAGDAGATIRASGIAGQLGKSDIKGDVAVTLTGTRPFIDAGFSSKNIDVGVLLGSGGEAVDKRQTDESKKADRLFSDDPLSLGGLTAVDAAFRFDAAALTGRRGTLRNVAVIASLKKGLLDVSQLKAELYDGVFEGTVQIDGRTESAGMVANASLQKIDLGPVLEETTAAGTIEGRINFTLDAKGEGRSVREIMAGLDGKVALAMGKGRIRSKALQRWVGGPRQILSNVLTLDASGYSAVNCALGSFDIKQGLATSNGLLLDTEVAAFVGTGTVNLDTEVLDLIIDPKIKKMTLSAAVPVRIRGTLANPDYSLDEKAVARRVGGLLGGLVFPPALILGLGELGTFGEGGCAGSKGSAESQAAPAQPAQTTGEEPGNLPGKILKGTGESITKGLKKLFGD